MDRGSWKFTDPLPEIAESKKTAEDTNNNFKYIANMLRVWKNKQGFKFGGLLIDTLTYKFLNEKTQFRNIGFDSYFEMTKELFSYLKDLNKEQSYWYAIGSNQQVYNCENGKFITKADKAYKKIKDLTDESSNVNKKLREIFGTQFPKKQVHTNESRNTLSSYFEKSYRHTEEFIEDLFPVDIRYTLKIDCKVIQDGFRPTLLRLILKNNNYLKVKKELEFYIGKIDTKLEKPYEIYWKVKNEGEVAIEKDCIRGQIERTNSPLKKESSDFKGKHYVECYIVKNGVCVAKNHLEVPISNYESFMG